MNFCNHCDHMTNLKDTVFKGWEYRFIIVDDDSIFLEFKKSFASVTVFWSSMIEDTYLCTAIVGGLRTDTMSQRLDMAIVEAFLEVSKRADLIQKVCLRGAKVLLHVEEE